MPLVDLVDAQSQDSGGGACECTIAEPVTISQPVAVVGKVVTAEDNPENWRLGSVDLSSNTTAKLADGPLVVTQVSASLEHLSTGGVDGHVDLFVSHQEECVEAKARYTLINTHRAIGNSGAKLFVPAGDFLCAENTGLFPVSATVAWWGYVPQ